MIYLGIKKSKKYETALVSKRYKNFERELSISSYIQAFSYKYQTLPIKVFYTQQCIIDDNNNILYCLAVKNDWFENVNNYVDIRNDKLRLYLSIDFTRNPKYKNLYKKLSESFIDKFLDEGIEVVIKSSENIDKDMFSTNFAIPSFNTVEEAEEHLKSDIEDILFENTDMIYA